MTLNYTNGCRTPLYVVSLLGRAVCEAAIKVASVPISIVIPNSKFVIAIGQYNKRRCIMEITRTLIKTIDFLFCIAIIISGLIFRF